MVADDSDLRGRRRVLLSAAIGVGLVVGVASLYPHYLGASWTPPLVVTGDLDLGPQPAWKPVRTTFRVSNPSPDPIIVERLDKF